MRLLAGAQYGLCGLLVAAGLYAAWQVNRGWNDEVNNIIEPIDNNDACVSWLRAQFPDDPALTAWQWGYNGHHHLYQQPGSCVRHSGGF